MRLYAATHDSIALIEPQGEAAPREATPATSGARLTRRRRTADPFSFDQRIIPAGFSYEWKRESVFGEPDTTHMIEMRENHWKPVPASRHPELAMMGDTVIRRGGTVLCERPKPVQQMEEVMYGTKPGELTRDHPSVRRIAGVRQQWSPGEPVNESGEGLSSEP